VEDRVNIHGGQKLELVSMFAYFLDNWESPIMLVVQLP
jgi:hypothetical protein